MGTAHRHYRINVGRIAFLGGFTTKFTVTARERETGMDRLFICCDSEIPAPRVSMLSKEDGGFGGIEIC
jgi:hypothetical protein